jgi:hypothetical protein
MKITLLLSPQDILVLILLNFSALLYSANPFFFPRVLGYDTFLDLVLALTTHFCIPSHLMLKLLLIFLLHCHFTMSMYSFLPNLLLHLRLSLVLKYEFAIVTMTTYSQSS